MQHRSKMRNTVKTRNILITRANHVLYGRSILVRYVWGQEALSHSRSTGKFMIPVSALQVGVKTPIWWGHWWKLGSISQLLGLKKENIRRGKDVDVMEKYNSWQKYNVVTHVCYVGTALDVPRGCLFSCELKSHICVWIPRHGIHDVSRILIKSKDWLRSGVSVV